MPESRPGHESAAGTPRAEPPDEEANGSDDDDRPSPEVRADPPKPLLASEALKEDLAPIQPWAAGGRWWMAGCGLWFVLIGLAPFFGAPSTGEPSASTVIGGIALAGALAPVGYRPRALLMLMTAVAVALLAVAGAGPASVVGETHGAWTVLHLTAAVALAAALFFGNSYRAYHRARAILAVGLAAAVPFVIYAIVVLARGTLSVQIVTGLALAAVVVSSLGFMGAETTVAGPWVAAAVIATITAQLAFESFALAALPDDPIALCWAIASVIAFAATGLLGALALFMLLAARHWKRARIVDLHRHVVEHAEPSLTDSWSTRR